MSAFVGRAEELGRLVAAGRAASAGEVAAVLDLTLAMATSAPVSSGETPLSTVPFPIYQTNPNQDPIVAAWNVGGPRWALRPRPSARPPERARTLRT
jgi:hypothetical protein